MCTACHLLLDRCDAVPVRCADGSAGNGVNVDGQNLRTEAISPTATGDAAAGMNHTVSSASNNGVLNASSGLGFFE